MSVSGHCGCKTMNFLGTTFLLSTHVLLLSALRLLDGPPLNCTQEGLRCRANINNCLDKGWLQPKDFTPTGPDKLHVTHSAVWEKGKLVPVLQVTWKARTDGSIRFLEGTEVHLLKMSSNQNFCVRYIFLNKINSMKNVYSERWSFSLDRLVVEPDQMYLVTVYNLPKPNLDHDTYNVSKAITIPGCEDPLMRNTKVCLESGSLWTSNITLRRWKRPGRDDAITVHFNGGMFSTKYRVSVECSGVKHSQITWQGNQTQMNVSFELGKWPQTCCEFSAEIQPFFTQCENDCVRHQKVFNICSETKKSELWPFIVIGVFLTLGAAFCICYIYVWLRRPHKDVPTEEVHQEDVPIPPNNPDNLAKPPSAPRRVLVVYSLDHALYREIVLKLSAFLRAKCGTDVVLDLLDTAWLSTVGRLQWLDWQKQQMEKSSDKILILCSRGVQAKWRAMCGGHRVMLKEDVRSPTGDMLTPAFSLIIPDLMHPVAFGKYMVAYFDDVSSEEDVPPPFNITVKYKLMKHFEELYFRILDKEKYEPGKVNRIEGIAEDEYFNCPSGKALRDAIETFQAYQVENPDWFEKECMDSEEEALDAGMQCPLLVDMHGSSIFQCVPEYRNGPPILMNTVNVSEEAGSIFQCTPIINDEMGKVFTQHVDPVAYQDYNSVCSVHPDVQWDHSQVYSVNPGMEDCPEMYRGEIHPAICHNAAIQQLHPQGCPEHQERLAGLPVEADEDQPVSLSCLSEEGLKNLIGLQQSLGPRDSQAFHSEDDEFQSEVASDWVQVANPWKRPLSGSDQGYISRTSPQQDFQDNLGALSRLQNTCLSLSLKPLGNHPGTPHISEDYENVKDLWE